jgi:prevent-host-death family protein
MARKRTRPGTVAAAEFKARCLELMDRVRETRAEYVVTKHGTPVAKLVPYDAPARPRKIFGSMRGTVRFHEGAFEPLPDEWFTDPFLNPKK